MENDVKQPAELPPGAVAVETTSTDQTAVDDVVTGARLVMLGDEPYRVINFERRTVLIDHYLQKWIRSTGSDKFLPDDGEDSTMFVMRLQTQIIDSGHACDLVAGFILPEGVATERDWTVETAKATARKIAYLTSAEDHELVATLCLEIAFGFFKVSIERFARAQVYAATAEHALSGKPTH